MTALPHQRVFFKFAHDNPQCAVQLPPGFSKTTCLVAMGVWSLGRDPTSRGAFVGAAAEISRKPAGQALALIEHIDDFYPEIRLVFPHLRPSSVPHSAWSAGKFVVERPPGIRDASCVALGLGSRRVIGSRLEWIFVDDLLTIENTRTPEARAYAKQWLMQIAKARLDPSGGRMVVTNVPYDPDDLMHYLAKPSNKELPAKARGAGWPTLKMNAQGRIEILNAPDWDCDEIRPSAKEPGTFRLVDHDSDEFAPRAYSWSQVRAVLPPERLESSGELQHVDLDDEVPLWPEVFPVAKLDEIEAGDEMSVVAFARNYRLNADADLLRRCKKEWLDRSKELASLAGFHTTQGAFGPDGAWFTTTGLDIGGLRRGTHDDSACIFTLATLTVPIVLGGQDAAGKQVILRPGTRRVVEVRYGKWASAELVTKLAQTIRAYGSFARIERNSEESFTQWMDEVDASLPITPHTTGMNKHHAVWGVESVFLAMQKDLFLIPNRDGVILDPDLQRFHDALRDYEPPPAHTDDGIMACWMAIEEARSIWQPPLPGQDAGPAPQAGSGLASIGVR